MPNKFPIERYLIHHCVTNTFYVALKWKSAFAEKLFQATNWN